VTERTESPDGSRRAAFVGALYRTARAVPLLCRTGAVHGTSMAMECSDLSELWISLGLRASRTTGGTGRLAPCRFCGRAVPDGSRRAAFVPNRRGTRHADGYGVLRLVGALDFLGTPSVANDRRNRTARAVPLLLDWIRGDAAQCRRTAGQVELMRFVIVIGA
jgi:hypothetical protein